MPKTNMIIVYTVVVCLSCLYLETQVHSALASTFSTSSTIKKLITWHSSPISTFSCAFGAMPRPYVLATKCRNCWKLGSTKAKHKNFMITLTPLQASYALFATTTNFPESITAVLVVPVNIKWTIIVFGPKLVSVITIRNLSIYFVSTWRWGSFSFGTLLIELLVSVQGHSYK